MIVGDIVKLKSGGCAMTIVAFIANGDAVCEWHGSDGQTRKTSYVIAAIELSTPGGGGVTIPAGIITEWAGLLAAIPTGWILCDGSMLTVLLQPALFAAIGNRYGGDGITTFQLPDLRGKFTRGAAAGIEPGTTGGSLTHTHAAHAFTPAGGIAWPAQPPTFSGTPLGGHSHDSSALTLSAVSAGTPAGTNSVPAFTGSALANHAHELPFQLVSGTSVRHLAGTVFGTGTSRAAQGTDTATANTTSAAVALSEAKSAGTPAGTVSAPTFTGSPLATHSHTISGGTDATGAGTPIGSIAYPVQAPMFTGTPDTLTHDTASNLPPWFEIAFIIKL